MNAFTKYTPLERIHGVPISGGYSSGSLGFVDKIARKIVYNRLLWALEVIALSLSGEDETLVIHPNDRFFHVRISIDIWNTLYVQIVFEQHMSSINIFIVLSSGESGLSLNQWEFVYAVVCYFGACKWKLLWNMGCPVEFL